MPNRRNLRRQLTLRPRPLLPNRILPPANNGFSGQSAFPDGRPYREENFPVFAAVSGTCETKIPTMSPLAFETFFMFYLLAALFSQYLFIFKTVWWYPPALPPSTTTVNFHLIDKTLTVFLVILFSRRLMWVVMWNYIRPSPENGPKVMLWAVSCLVILGFCFVEMGSNVYNLLNSESSFKLFLLCYPILLMALVNCWSEEGCLQSMINYIGKKTPRNRPQILTQRIPEHLEAGNTSKDASSHIDAQQVQEDVKRLCKNFNSRLTEIIFGSMVCAYYSGLVPMFFTKAHHSYDVAWSFQYTALVLVNSFTMLALYLLPPHYLQSLNKCALLLGSYQQVNVDSKEHVFGDEDIPNWSSHVVYNCGDFVEYDGCFYKALAKNNTAIPGNSTHSRFFYIFSKPLRVMKGLLGLHLSVVLFQIYVIFSASHWDHTIAPTILQFFSYYILYIMLRDFLIMKKLHEMNCNDLLIPVLSND